MLNFNISTFKFIELVKNSYSICTDLRSRGRNRDIALMYIYQKDLEVSFCTSFYNISTKKNYFTDKPNEGFALVKMSSLYYVLNQFGHYQEKVLDTLNPIFNVFYDEITSQLVISFENTSFKLETFNNDEVKCSEFFSLFKNFKNNFENLTSFNLPKYTNLFIDPLKGSDQSSFYDGFPSCSFKIDFNNGIFNFIDNRLDGLLFYSSNEMNFVNKFDSGVYYYNIPYKFFTWFSHFKHKEKNLMFYISGNDIYIVRDLVNSISDYYATFSLKRLNENKLKASQQSLFENAFETLRKYRKLKLHDNQDFNNVLNFKDIIKISNVKVSSFENIYNDVDNYNVNFGTIQVNFNNLFNSLALYNIGAVEVNKATSGTIRVAGNNLNFSLISPYYKINISQNIPIVNPDNVKFNVSLNLNTIKLFLNSFRAKFFQEYSNTKDYDLYLSLFGNDNNYNARLTFRKKTLVDNYAVNNFKYQLNCSLSKDYKFYKKSLGM